MKHKLRKYFRKEERKQKKMNKNKKIELTETSEPEKPAVITKKPKKIREKREDSEKIQRNKNTKTIEKNWKKIKKNLELEGLGSDFYDLLEGKLEINENDEAIENIPNNEEEIEFVSNPSESEKYQESEEFEGFEEPEETEDFEELEDSEEFEKKNSTKTEEFIHKKQKIDEDQDRPIFFPQSSDDLQRKLKGLLNRLSDQNIEPLTLQISEMFKTCSNSALNQIFWEFLSGSLTNTKVPTQLLAVYAAEISALSKFVGREVSAFIIDKLYSQINDLNTNKASFWSYLYYFKVISSEIMVGFIKFLLESIDEIRVEMIIIVFTLIGFTLRKNEPGLLKEMINSASEACKKCEITSTRMKFMIETLTDIKNNKKKQNLAEDRLKFLKNWLRNSVSKATGIKESQISVKWSDLQSSNWRSLLTPSSTIEKKPKFSAELESLARFQHMNTESRKTIFCLLMSSEDFMDAFAKLSALSKKERDIVRVIINCCGQEGVYNKFYALVGIQLCKHKNSYQYSFQYALWDYLKQFQDFSIRKISNIAKFYAEMVLNGAVYFTILKAVDFDEMNEHLSLFLRILIEEIVRTAPVLRINEIFDKVAKNEKLKEFCEGVRMFVKLVILAHPRKGVLEEIGLDNFNSRVKALRKSLKIRN